MGCNLDLQGLVEQIQKGVQSKVTRAGRRYGEVHG